MLETSVKNGNKETYLRISLRNGYINLFINNRFENGEFIEELPFQGMSFNLFQQKRKNDKKLKEVFNNIVNVKDDIFNSYLKGYKEYIKQILEDSIL